jgi:hypothetical protein
VNWLVPTAKAAAPPVVLASTRERTLDVVPLEVLRQHAVDVPDDLGNLLGRRHVMRKAWGRMRPLFLLTASTPFAYPQVVSCTFALFRVLKSSVSAGQADFWSGFDSRQLHHKTADETV